MGWGGLPTPLVSMSKPLEKQKAVELRRAGLSYREIRRQVSVSKSTLSLWLRSVGLSYPQKQRLTAKKLLAGRRGGRKVHLARVERVQRTLAEGEAEAKQRLEDGDVSWAIGTALYWAEGTKEKAWRTAPGVDFTNMDPTMVALMRAWLQRNAGVSESDVSYAIYIHKDADINAALQYWTARLSVSSDRFKVYLKRPNHLTRRKNVGRDYHGTIRIRVRRSTGLNRRIAGWISGLVRYCGVV